MDRLLPALLLMGCVIPPDLPHLDELPAAAAEVEACAPPRETRVVRVLDGDTVDLAPDGERIRMLGVDAPEISHGGSQPDCWGDEAHAALDEILGDRQVTLTFDADCEGIFGRTLAYVWLREGDFDHLRHAPGIERHIHPLGPGEGDEGLLVNAWVIDQGHAPVYAAEIFGSLGYQDELERAEADARAAQRGLWGACGGG